MKRARDFSGFPAPKRLKTDYNELLNAIFRFKHKTPSDCQDEALCNVLVKQLAGLVATLKPVTVASYCCALVNPFVDDRTVPVSEFADHEVDVLLGVGRRLESSGDDIHNRGYVWYDPWLPMYGCALQRTKISAAAVKLEVIFVDGWERMLHFLPTGNCVHSAVPKTFNTLHCADLDAALEEKFGRVFDAKLRKAQLDKGSKRSAAVNFPGHQKTPQFIAAVVRRAVAVVTSIVEEDEDVSSDERFSPHGGTTDVGQHTGGRPRDTCWSLVQAMIAHNLCCGQRLFQKTMVKFKMNLLQSVVSEMPGTFGRGSNVKDGCDAVDDIFFMLQEVVQSAVELIERGYDVSSLYEECSRLRVSIEEFVDSLNHHTAIPFRLPDFTTMQQLSALECGVNIDSPKRDWNLNTQESSETRHTRVLTNLERCWFLDGATCSLDALLQWEKVNSAPKSYKCILVMRTFETFIFERSLKLTGEGIFKHPDDDNELLAGKMWSLVSTYQRVVCEWRQLPQITSVSSVEQRSREMLVIWIAFCLVHQRCLNEVPLCAEYNIALEWKDLKVAVLRDRAAMSALQRVAKYIRGWNEETKGPQLFLMMNQKPTFDFARKFGLNCASMIDTYDREVEIWKAYVKRKWNEITQKKTRATELRTEISRLDENLQSKQYELAEEKRRLNEAYLFGQYAGESGAQGQLTADINRIRSELKKAKALVKKVLSTPPPLTRPLPAVKEDAIQVIFMLTMPRNLEILGSLCLTAQCAIAPVESSTETKQLPSLINSPSTEKMLQVERNVYEMMSRRIETLASFVKKDTDKVLTSLVHLVSATSPEQLEWKEIEELSRSDEQFGCCFESADS
ncbi:hypothetical protein PC123_g449 [Phytophthora cactorum]|nr:hypothetical protein PC123_g449 [Phytophthora cactorum]